MLWYERRHWTEWKGEERRGLLKKTRKRKGRGGGRWLSLRPLLNLPFSPPLLPFRRVVGWLGWAWNFSSLSLLLSPSSFDGGVTRPFPSTSGEKIEFF